MGDGDDADSCDWSTGTSWFEEEDREDPYPPERLRAEQTAAEADPAYPTQLWWGKRAADRRYRAATGRFMPTHKAKRRSIWEESLH